jgi:DHA1 family bicyclomycin/chloramphenicol resistance-like MFS transporter
MTLETERTVSAKAVMSERRVSLLGALIVAVAPLSNAMFTPAMPDLVDAFGTTEGFVKMTLSLYFAGFAIAQLFCGTLSDGFGRKPVIMAFLAVYLASSLLALLAPNIEILIAARFLQGVGAAVGVSVARAIVRDLFTGEPAARIINMIWLILGIGPALAPTLGGVTIELFGWQAVFVLMLLGGALIAVIVQLLLVETIRRDLSRIQPRTLVRSYGALLGNAYFLSSSLVMMGAMGALHTLAVLLPFILIDHVGLSPGQFGVGMLVMSGSFLAGSVITRLTMRRLDARRLVPIGILFVATGSAGTAVLLRLVDATFLTVVGPAALVILGLAFLMPAALTAALAPFPHMAGAAASLSGFLQMSGGVVGGTAALIFIDPIAAAATIVPAMGAGAIASWLWWRMLPEPAIVTSVSATQSDLPPPPS